MTIHPITEQTQYTDLTDKLDTHKFVCIPLWVNDKHAIENEIIAVGIYVDNDLYIVNHSHSDFPQFELGPVFERDQNMVLDKRLEVMYHYTVRNAIDLQSLFFCAGEEVPLLQDYMTPFHKNIYNRFPTYKNLNRAIPMAKWIESLTDMFNEVKLPEMVRTPTAVYNQMVIPTLQAIESAGLYVDEALLKEKFPTAEVIDGFVYSKYNMFNTTGRPSNSHNNINFLALNKTDGTREAFISRFGKDGMLVQYDFDSYHLRLLAGYMGIDLPPTSLHRQLAHEYYGADEITEEMYNESKQKTFAILYGNFPTTSAPKLLQDIKSLEDTLWESYSKTGYFEAKFSKRKIVVETPHKSKVFNYFVQNLEFETTLYKLHKLSKILSDRRSKAILYTYDAILFDCLEAEYGELRPIVEAVLTDGALLGATSFPVKETQGKTYNNMS